MNATLAVMGIFVGWTLKSIADYLVFRHRDMRTYNAAIFFLLRAWKLLKDYDRGTDYFRSSKPDVPNFEKWRAIVASRFLDNYSANADTISEAVKLVAQVDPVLAVRLDNTLRNVVFSFQANWPEIADTDHQRYAQLVANQDVLVDLALSEMKSVAGKLAGRSSLRQQVRVSRYFRSVVVGTKDFVEGMDAQREMLEKVVSTPNSSLQRDRER